jgi:NDP-sugar pyrophosphorylase family protein
LLDHVISIDVYKFSEQSGGSFFEKCFEYIHGKREVNLWSEVALNDTFKVHRFLPCHIRGRWFEIDTLEDLASAEQLFAID